MNIDLRELQKLYDKEIATDLYTLWSLKGKKDDKSKAERKKLRIALRNAGILSLPFSMNRKK